MAFHKQKQDDSEPVRVYCYGLLGPEDAESAKLVHKQMLRAHAYQQELSKIVTVSRERYREIISGVPDIAELQSSIKLAYEELKQLGIAAKARRSEARSKKIKLPEEPRAVELKASIKVLKTRLAEVKAELDDPEVKAAIAANNALCYSEEKTARAAVAQDVPENGHPASPRLYWSTYNLVEASIKQAAQTKMGPALRPHWDGCGRIGVQLQGGLSTADVLAGTDTQLRIEEVDWAAQPRFQKRHRPPPRCAHGNPLATETEYLRPSCGCLMRALRSGEPSGHNRRQMRLRIRVGSTDAGKPVWASFVAILHRPLPADGDIKLAVVTKKRVGTRSIWQLHLTVRSKTHRPEATPAITSHAALDIGWRARLPGLRVFYLLGSDGHEQELLAPKDIEAGFTKTDEIRSRRDKEFNACKAQLMLWLKSSKTTPAWLNERTETLGRWRSIARLSSLTSRWRDNRFEGDEEIFAVTIAWYHHNKHLYQWESSLRQKTIRRRNYYYHLQALEITKRYPSIVLEKLDLRPLIRRDSPWSKEELHQAARHNRFIAAPGVFRSILLATAKKHGCIVTKKSAKNTTAICHRCNKSCEFDRKDLVHICEHCGHSWDQDLNADKNLLNPAFTNGDVAKQ